MDKRLAAIFLVTTSCMFQGPLEEGRRSLKAQAGDENTTGKKSPHDTFGPPLAEEKIYWSDRATSFPGVLEVSDRFDSVMYLRGGSVDRYLKNQTDKGQSGDVYCLVFNFNNPRAKDQYRVRAVPFSIQHFKEEQHEYMLRVDLATKAQECQGGINSFYGTMIGTIVPNLTDTLIYITTTGASAKGLYSYSPNNGYTNFSTAQGLASSSVRDVWANGATLLVATSKGLSLSTDDGQTFISKTQADGLASNSLSSVSAGTSGQQIALGSDGGLTLSTNGGQSFTRRTTAQGLSSNRIKDVWTNGTALFVATYQGLDYSANFGGTFTSLLSTETHSLSAYTQGGQSVVLASSINGLSLYRTDGTLIKTLTGDQVPPSNRVRTAFYDGSTLAVATNTGLALYSEPISSLSATSGGLIEVITTANGLANNNIKGVALWGGNLYLATPSKFYKRSFSQTNTNFQEIPPTTFALRLNEVCPQCRNLESVTTKLYRAGSLEEPPPIVDLEEDMARIGLRIHKGGDENLARAGCSYSYCNSLGYDCCLGGQCVKDGDERPEALGRSQSDPTGFGAYYTRAKHNVSENPLSFIDYTDIYYVCPQVVLQEAVTTHPLEGPQIQAQKRFEREKREYLCLQAVKENPDDFSQCQDENADSTVNTIDWQAVRTRVWKRCGCRSATLETPTCPDYGLRVERNAQNTITAVLCDVPQPLQAERPLQIPDILLPSRSVPHRFYRGDNGRTVDDVFALFQREGSIPAEGPPFSYLDLLQKMEPESGRFNMNAILGPMKADLTWASPAKMIPVEYGQDYILMATEGSYAPCPDCPGDSWFENFSAHPSSSKGVGLRATGQTHRRDTFSLNTTLGNYEDTLFGRACWVPPTMIPFTHRPGSDTAVQRQRRLAAQAALYINGYQRDWYGFNKGALIGSFDGVRWFAIGTGRRVTATSEKLFLALNAPFGDLAGQGDINVSITVDLGDNEASDFDFNPELALYDPLQNQGGHLPALPSV